MRSRARRGAIRCTRTSALLGDRVTLRVKHLPSSIRIVVLSALASFALACAGAPFPRQTRADNARTDDPWLAGDTCPPHLDDTGVQVEEIEAGSGAAVGMGETVRVHYTATARDGAKLHDTHDGGPPIEIVIGSTKTICGFEKGIVGMRPGGQRRVIVPWRLAFGESGRSPDVEPKTDLIFVVDLFLPADPAAHNGTGPPRPPMPGRRR